MRLPVGLLDELEAALMEGESRTGFVVEAVRRELAARGLERELALTPGAPREASPNGPPAVSRADAFRQAEERRKR